MREKRHSDRLLVIADTGIRGGQAYQGRDAFQVDRGDGNADRTGTATDLFAIF
ncbi:hypothetical protein UF75_4808 [Desulfosporosinus sp. I2]|nr:hypothetical protein UF75_4808 [Desulfosporosinus sp. I2]